MADYSWLAATAREHERAVTPEFLRARATTAETTSTGASSRMLADAESWSDWQAVQRQLKGLMGAGQGSTAKTIRGVISRSTSSTNVNKPTAASGSGKLRRVNSTPEFRDDCLQVLRFYDRSGRGQLSRRDIAALFKDLGRPYTEADVRVFIAQQAPSRPGADSLSIGELMGACQDLFAGRLGGSASPLSCVSQSQAPLTSYEVLERKHRSATSFDYNAASLPPPTASLPPPRRSAAITKKVRAGAARVRRAQQASSAGGVTAHATAHDRLHDKHLQKTLLFPEDRIGKFDKVAGVKADGARRQKRTSDNVRAAVDFANSCNLMDRRLTDFNTFQRKEGARQRNAAQAERERQQRQQLRHRWRTYHHRLRASALNALLEHKVELSIGIQQAQADRERELAQVRARRPRLQLSPFTSTLQNTPLPPRMSADEREELVSREFAERMRCEAERSLARQRRPLETRYVDVEPEHAIDGETSEVWEPPAMAEGMPEELERAVAGSPVAHLFRGKNTPPAAARYYGDRRVVYRRVHCS